MVRLGTKSDILANAWASENRFVITSTDLLEDESLISDFELSALLGLGDLEDAIEAAQQSADDANEDLVGVYDELGDLQTLLDFSGGNEGSLGVVRRDVSGKATFEEWDNAIRLPELHTGGDGLFLHGTADAIFASLTNETDSGELTLTSSAGPHSLVLGARADGAELLLNDLQLMHLADSEIATPEGVEVRIFNLWVENLGDSSDDTGLAGQMPFAQGDGTWLWETPEFLSPPNFGTPSEQSAGHMLRKTAADEYEWHDAFENVSDGHVPFRDGFGEDFYGGAMYYPGSGALELLVDLDATSVNGTFAEVYTGLLNINGVNWPSEVGTENQVLTVDGSGGLIFADVPGGGGGIEEPDSEGMFWASVDTGVFSWKHGEDDGDGRMVGIDGSNNPRIINGITFNASDLTAGALFASTVSVDAVNIGSGELTHDDTDFVLNSSLKIGDGSYSGSGLTLIDGADEFSINTVGGLLLNYLGSELLAAGPTSSTLYCPSDPDFNLELGATGAVFSKGVRLFGGTPLSDRPTTFALTAPTVGATFDQTEVNTALSALTDRCNELVAWLGLDGLGLLHDA